MFIVSWYAFAVLCNINKRATSRGSVSSGIFDQVRFKPACSATETNQRIIGPVSLTGVLRICRIRINLEIH